MENSYLNTAHYHGRKADNHTKYRRYDEAIKHHEKAIINLTEAIKCTSSPKAEECLILQKNNHKRQIELLRLKKAHFEKYKKALEHSKKDFKTGSDEFKKNVNTTLDLQLAIYKTMEDADSLLEILESPEATKKHELSHKDLPCGTVKAADVHEKSKDTNVAATELRKLNRQLHMLVHRLVTKLDEATHETQELRNKIQELEKIKSTKDGSRVPREKPTAVVTDDSFDYSSSGDRSPDAYETKEIPLLAPLELPKFDFDTFDCKTTEN